MKMMQTFESLWDGHRGRITVAKRKIVLSPLKLLIVQLQVLQVVNNEN